VQWGIEQAQQGIVRRLAIGSGDHGRGDTGIGPVRKQFLGARQRTGVRRVLHVAALEVEAAGVKPEGDDAEKRGRRKGDDHQALRALAAAKVDQHFSTP
jgi:hypothetical protein